MRGITTILQKELKRVLEEDTYDMVTATSRFRVGWFFF